MKYRPDFPARYTSIQEARNHCKAFLWWYNHEHYHCGIGYHHPADVHYGHIEGVYQTRAEVLGRRLPP